MSDILKQINNPLFRARGSQSLNRGGITSIPMSEPRMDFQNRQSLINPALNLSRASTINDIDDEDAKRIGGSIIPESVFKKTQPNLESMATDDKSKVDSNLTGLYDGGGDIAKIMGALTKLSKDDGADKVYQKLIDKKTSPEDAKAEVNKFFGVSPEEKTPAWADSALAIGASLLKQPKAGETPLQTLGTALAAGGVAAKAKKKEKRAEELAINKLAFNLYKEDEKSRKALATKYATYKENKVKNTTKLGMDLAKLLLDKNKLDETKSKNFADAITKTVNTFDKDVRSDLFVAMQKNKNYFKGIPLDKVPEHIYALAKENGIEASGIKAADIVTNDIQFNTKAQFDQYKELYPNLGWGDYDPNKTYTMQGFKNKLKPNELFTGTPNLKIEDTKQKSETHILVDEITKLKTKGSLNQDEQAALQVFENRLDKLTSVTKPDNRTALRKEQDNLNTLKKEKKSVQIGDPGRDLNTINREIAETEGRISKLTTTVSMGSYLAPDGTFYNGPIGKDGLGGLKKEAQIKDLKNRQFNFVRAVYIGDAILQNLAKPQGEQAVGLFQRFGNAIEGLSVQIRNFSGISRDDQARYSASNIDNLIGNNSGRTAETFKALKTAAGQNQNLMSAVMDYAYALAGSRETGKLTDKDVAAALRTLGGEDLSENAFFTNPDRLKKGVNAAINLANNNLGVAIQSSLNETLAMEKKRNPEVDESEYIHDPIKLVKTLMKGVSPNLHKRLFVGKTDFTDHGLSYQSFDKYQQMHDNTTTGGGGTTVLGSTDAVYTVANKIKSIGSQISALSGLPTQTPEIIEAIEKLKTDSKELINNLNSDDKAKVKEILGIE